MRRTAQSGNPVFKIQRYMKSSALKFVFLLVMLMLSTGNATETVPTQLAFTPTFTPAEKAYLEGVGVIKMCVDPDWAPFETINQQGQHEGIAADLIQMVAKRVGLRIELYPVKDWEASLAASKSKRCQIMSFLNQTPARDVWLTFTDPIFYDPNVIITREEHGFVADAKGLQNETVALPRGTMIEERIRRDFPSLKIVLTSSEPEAMVLVSERKADMTIRSLIVAANAIKKEGLFNLKISGQIPEYTNQLRIGVLKEERLLQSILNKGVQTITPQEREAISNKHVRINVQQGIDYRLVWQILGGASLTLMLVILWNRKLNALNKKLELARQSMSDSINYALLIQHAILPDHPLKQTMGEQFFVLWLPRDVVGGDFYFYRGDEGGKLFGVIDCAGHGVPGACMTMAAHAAIEVATQTVGYQDPAAILMQTDTVVRNMLPLNDKTVATIDASFCHYAADTQTLTFAGAHQSLFWTDGVTCQEVNGGRRSLNDRKRGTYTNVTLPVASSHTYYLISDGLLDQAGGESQHGFGTKRFCDWVLQHAHLSLAQQRQALVVALEAYRGDQPQRDDITVFAFRLT